MLINVIPIRDGLDTPLWSIHTQAEMARVGQLLYELQFIVCVF